MNQAVAQKLAEIIGGPQTASQARLLLMGRLTAEISMLDNADMANRIIIERLEFQGRCGVAPEERRRPQPLAIDLELEFHTEPRHVSDNIHEVVDYAQVAERIVELGTTHECALLETFSERILTMLFTEFPVDRVKLWLRKLTPPILYVTGSVGVQLDRTRMAHPLQPTETTPARFLTQQLHRLPKGRALDVATGSGRNALYLVSHGFQVDAIDRDEQMLATLAARAKQENLPNLSVQTIDLERTTDDRQEFSKNTYDVIVVFFYLYRPLFPWLIDALRPNGVLIYETFTIDNYFRHHHPRRWEFCLAQNELLRLTSDLRVLSYDEGEHDGGHGFGPAFTAQLVAKKSGLPERSYGPH
jgi:dihydroneopterin aldolase